MITANQAITIVADRLQVDPMQMMGGGSQSSPLVHARWVVMRVLMGTLRMSSTEVGRVMNMDHSTVLYGRNQLAGMLAKDGQLAALVTAIEAEVLHLSRGDGASPAETARVARRATSPRAAMELPVNRVIAIAHLTGTLWDLMIAAQALADMVLNNETEKAVALAEAIADETAVLCGEPTEEEANGKSDAE